MYLIYSDKTDEFARIKAVLGPGSRRASTRHALLTAIEEDPSVRVVIIAPSIRGDAAFTLASELRLERPLINLILIRSRIDVPTLTSALESGIKEVIDSQDATGLMNAVQRCESVIERMESLVAHDESRKRRGKVIVVYSAKGGCGKTTIASNLASALTHQDSTRVCLLDLDLQFGDIGTSLRMNPTKTISHAIEMGAQLDADELLSNLMSYREQFDVLLAPVSPVDIERISADFVSRIVSSLQNHYDFIIIDTAPTMSEVIVRTLQESDMVLVITTLDMSSIKNTKLTIAALDALGLPASRRMLLLNHSDLKVGLDPLDVEDLLGEPISLKIPSSSKVALTANRGELIVDAFPSNSVSKAISELAHEVRRFVEHTAEVSVA